MKKQCTATDHDGRKVSGTFVRHADKFNSVINTGGEWSIFVIRSTVKFVTKL